MLAISLALRAKVMISNLQEVAESALLHAALGKRGALNHDFRPAYPGAKLLGRALTIRSCPGDNLMFHLAISVARPGDVLVATVDNYLEGGGWGEIATVAAQARGVNGFLTDGSVRDVEAAMRLKFPLFSRGICLKGTTKRQKGELNQPITLGGVLVHPGDYVVADMDGVVIVPAGEVEAAIAEAHAIRKREAVIMQRLKQGELTLDLMDMRPTLKELGLDT
jgi:4-hydroxy-4-methyl-2-oxoglutarate aldolase